MKSLGLLPARALFGSRDIGNPWVTVTDGYGDAGIVLHMLARIGRIRITTIIAKAGSCTKDIGTAKTTTTTTGRTIIASEGMGTMMIMGMSIVNS